jgi:predicted DNA-binding transcriptional regulator YafY
MGQRSPTETLFGIVAAFVERSTWTQAELARKLETRPDTIRKHLTELQSSGFKFDREVDHPHVYWSVPKGWMPGALAFKTDEVGDVLRLIARAPRGTLRDRVLALAMTRLAGQGQTSTAEFEPTAVQTFAVGPEEEQWLTILEDAIAKKTVVKMRYFTASRRNVSWRHVSVHRLDLGPRPQFIATCHRVDDLRRFRVCNVLDAKHDPGMAYRRTTQAALAKLDRESFGGFRDEGPTVACTFFVREPEAVWVGRNLPDANIVEEAAPGGARFHLETTAVAALARFVAGLGGIARPETPELAAEVAMIAKAALANASTA